jgi:hypothetical protein
MDNTSPFQACKEPPRRANGRQFARQLHAKRVLLLLCICTALGTLPVTLLADERVTLSFAWPAGLNATVHYSATKTHFSETQVRRQGLLGSYTLQTQSTPDGLRIHFDHVEVHPDGFTGTATEVRLQRFITELANAMPSYLVDHAGAYVRLVGMADFQRNIHLAIEHFLSDLPRTQRKNIMRVADFLTSGRQLEANMVANWNQVVGAWTGVTLEQGRLYQSVRTDVVPALANIEVPVEAEIVYRGKVPCTARSTRRLCVQLDMQSSIASERLTVALEPLLRQWQQQHAAAVRLDQLEMNSTVRLVTEPDTLIPHRLKSSKTTLVKGWLGAQPLEANQIEESEVRYEYRRE